MNAEIQKLKNVADLAKFEYMRGSIDYDELTERVQPYITAVNVRGKEMAKEYRMPFFPLTKSKFLR